MGILFTEYGISIRILWDMVLYAWNETPKNELQGWELAEEGFAP
jgi:hypothetical protein